MCGLVFFLSRRNREARASEDVKAPLQPFGRCKLTSMENGFWSAERQMQKAARADKAFSI